VGRAPPADVAEEAYLLAEPLVGALNVALAKARAISDRLQPDELALAADTLVVADGQVLGKPGDAAEAAAMLRNLRGRAHTVLTGVAVLDGDGAAWGGVVSSQVSMRAYTSAAVAAYIARGEPFDKAGGYAVQDVVFRPVERVAGCYLNVVGLPVCAVQAGLEALGVGLGEWPASGRRPASDGRPASRGLQPPCHYCQAGAPRVAIA
jgi:MAF protein